MAVQRSSAVPIPDEVVASATAHQLPLVAIDRHGSLDALVNEYISRVHGSRPSCSRGPTRCTGRWSTSSSPAGTSPTSASSSSGCSTVRPW